MAFYDKFPYTNFQELNLDKILQSVGDIDRTAEEAAASAELAGNRANSAANSANSAAASAGNAAASATNAASSAQLAVDAEQNSMAAMEQLVTTNARIDTLIVDGTPTQGNTELLDIRTGADGVNYPTAGAATRGQYMDAVKNQIANDYSNIFSTLNWEPGKEYNAAGAIISSGTVNLSTFISVRPNATIYMGFDGESTYPNYNVYYIIQFNKSAQFLERTNVATSNTFTTRADCRFIRVEMTNPRRYRLMLSYNPIGAHHPQTSPGLYANICMNHDLSAYRSLSAIGDSYTIGYAVNTDNVGADHPEISYPAQIARRHGMTCFNYGVSGITAKGFRENEIQRVIDADPTDLYLISLGQNDINQNLNPGTDADITTYTDTFTGNLSYIVNAVKQHAPHATIVLICSWLYTDSTISGINYMAFDPRIKAVANYYSVPYIVPTADNLMRMQQFITSRQAGHPKAYGYNIMSIAVERLIGISMDAHPELYNDAIIA